MLTLIHSRGLTIIEGRLSVFFYLMLVKRVEPPQGGSQSLCSWLPRRTIHVSTQATVDTRTRRLLPGSRHAVPVPSDRTPPSRHLNPTRCAPAQRTTFAYILRAPHSSIALRSFRSVLLNPPLYASAHPFFRSLCALCAQSRN